ncbi:MAG: hypothetical protein Athens071426_95 [Parcubacteria group bacterium Athens0714_26]|nr:MAG: hypothetical protein Athens101426_331 [Parcubacteria group bacterium Athens1014_26]TSD03701.1 MAG: hypothetical protein Athens071426_95 [Parcubacteria group bacterium Athens0714_26]
MLIAIKILILVVLVVLVMSQFFIIIPAYMGRLVLDLLKTWLTGRDVLRPLGPGINFIWPWEKMVADSDTDIVTLSHKFKITLETADNEPVELNCSFTTIPHLESLAQFRKFKKEDRIGAIMENLQGFLTGIQKEYLDTNALMKGLEKIKEGVRKFIDTVPITTPANESSGAKMLIADYYGVRIPVFQISDVEPAPELVAATVKKRIVTEQNAARDKEMDNVRERAEKLVSDSKGTLAYIEALKIVQVQDGKVKEERKIFGLDSESRGPIVDAIKEVLINVFHKN